MSTSILREIKNISVKTKKAYPVIIKGFRGEPVRLDAVNIEKSFIIVAGKSGKTQMKLKVKYVYQCDDNTYQKLRKAFDSNDSEVLEQGWQKARPITLS